MRLLVRLLPVLSLVLLSTSAVVAQSPPPSPAADWADTPIIQIPEDELALRLVPLELPELEALNESVLAEVRTSSASLAEIMVQRLRLTKSGEPDPEQSEQLASQTIALLIQKKLLGARARAVLDAIEAKGGDVAADRAYLNAVAGLRPDLRVTFVGDEPAPVTAADVPLRRVDELVNIVAAEPPTHQRPKPWDVPVTEVELELQPLSTEEVLERLEAWRTLLQAEVAKRIYIDVLLNNTAKLEQSVTVRDEGARVFGLPPEDVELSDIKLALAERAEDQQRIITAIVDRMRVAIELCKRRGEDAQTYIDYIATSTGRRLNFSDISVLRVQLAQWITSPSGGLLVARKALSFIGIVLLFWLASRVAGFITRLAVHRVPKTSTLLGPVVAGIVQKVLLIIGVVIAAGAIGVDTGPLLAMIGAAGLVIGLALQGTLSNFASGILILINRPFDVGDVVDAGGVFGKVSAMNLVSTTILTFDNQIMLVPNNQIWNAVITNATGNRTRRIDFTFGIAYNAEIAKAVSVLEEVLAAHPKTLDDPAPVVRVHELADSSVNLIARPWVKTEDYWDVYWDLMRQVKERFDADGIGIPFPQRDLHVPEAIEIKMARPGKPESRKPVVASHTPEPPPPADPEDAVHETGPPPDDAD